MKNTLRMKYIYSLHTARIVSEYDTQLIDFEIKDSVCYFDEDEYMNNHEGALVKAFTLITAKDLGEPVHLDSYMIENHKHIELVLFVTVKSGFGEGRKLMYLYRIINDLQLKDFMSITCFNSKAVIEYLFNDYFKGNLSRHDLLELISYSNDFTLIKGLKKGLIIGYNGYKFYIEC